MKKTLLLLFSIILSASISAQSKMNFSLAKKIQEQNTQPVNVFIKGDIAVIKQLVKANGGIFNYSAGDIAVVTIPISQISTIAVNKAIQRIEAYPPHNKPLNDTMLINNNIIPVHNGQSPLTQPYDGSGVIVGFVDTGIDFTHPDFQDSTGKSRIKFLWDQTKPLASNTPMPYNYGQEWNNLQIDSGQAVGHSDVPFGGHGTHVAGVGVGNGLANGHYKGAAPKADIIMVAADLYSSSATIITDAVNYIYSKAQLLGEPCVINISLGDSYGSHDGQDLQAQLMSNMVNAHTGQSLVVAVGNDGNNAIHLGYTVTSDTNFTFFKYNASSGAVYIELWADTANFKNVDFAIGADQMLPVHSFRGRTGFSSISSHLGILQSDTLYNAGNRIGIIQTYGDVTGGTYSMEFYITPDSTAYDWRLITTGSGKFDEWSYDVVANALPPASTMPDSIYYKFPDTDETVCSSFQCLDNVIAVGNYTNQIQYIDYNGNPYVYTGNNDGALSITSSHGPTRTGMIKPDISGPGDMTVAAVVLSMVPDIIADGYPDALDLGGFHVRDGGSSHASPGVAGIAALYLQKNPTATAMDVKNAIINCTTHDMFTGSSLPNNIWGYGKANAFNALTGCMITGIENNKPGDLNSMLVYPNPSSNGNVINIDIAKISPTDKNELKIYNAIGKLVKTISIINTNTQLNNSLAPGVYFCNLIVNGRMITTEKLVVL